MRRKIPITSSLLVCYSFTNGPLTLFKTCIRRKIKVTYIASQQFKKVFSGLRPTIKEKHTFTTFSFEGKTSGVSESDDSFLFLLLLLEFNR